MKQKLLFSLFLWLTLLGSAWAQSNNALHFDGTNDYVSCANTNPTQFTVEAWVYPTALGKDQAIISALYVPSNKGMELHIGNDNKPIITISSNFTFIDVKGSTALTANTWTHLAATYNGTTVKLYINGIEANSVAASNYKYISGDVHLGKRYMDANYNYTGRIDEVRIWSTARTQNEIAAAMNTSLTGAEANLLDYFNFNQGTAGGTNTGITTLTDATIGANHGTLNGFALTGTTSNWVAGYTNSLTASSAEVSIERTSGSKATFTIASNTTWSIVDAPDWLNLDVTSGTGNATINLTTNQANTTGAARSIQLVITGANADDATVTVIQQTESISVSQNQLSIGASQGSTATFDIFANVDWSITGMPNWLSVSQQTGTGNATITVTGLSVNATVSERSANLTLTGAGVAIPVNIAVTQAPLLAVTITKTDASVINSTGTSMQEAIGTTTLGEVQKLEITAGSFTATDWQWIFNNRGNLSNLTHFTITDGITLVADIPSEVFNGGITYISVAKAQNTSEFTFFKLKNLKSVVLLDVKNISPRAFLMCDSLSSVLMPKVLTLGSQAFMECKSLTSIYLPELTSMEGQAFDGCTMLSTIRLPKVNSINMNLPFLNCSVLTNIMLGATPPAAFNTSFAGCSDTRYLIPIDESGKQLTGAELTHALEQYRNANDGNTTDSNWYGNKLGETLYTVTVDPTIAHGKVSVGGYQAAGATVPFGLNPDAQHTVSEVWYTTQSGVVQAITGNSFTMPAENITLSATFIPNVLKVLVNGTIEKTGSSLGNTITGISYKSITSLTIYGGHFTLADWQWMQSYKAYFTGLTHFTITNDISSVASSYNTSPFGNQIKEVSIAKLTNIYKDFLGGNTGITHANFPHVTKVSDFSFIGCTALTTFNCPLVKQIGDNVFVNCTSLTTAILPSLTWISASTNTPAFKNCSSLTHLILGANPPDNQGFQFLDCPATRNLTIANAQGEELANAYAAYRAAPDGNTTDNYWHGWQIDGGIDRFTLTPSSAITNGQINLSVWGLLPEGLNSELTIQPAEGYKLTEGTLRAYNTNDEAVAVAIEKNTNGVLSLTSQAFDVTVTAQFEGLPQMLTVIPAVNGTFNVTPIEGIVTGTPVTITAVQPATGYRLKEGFPKAYKTDSPETAVALTSNPDGTLTFNMVPHAVTVIVEFELQPYTVSVTANIPHGILAATPSENVTMGTEVMLTSTPTAGYKLVENSLRAYKTGDESAVVTITNGKFTMPAYGVTVTVAFEALPQVLTLAAVANGTLSAAPAQQVATDTEVTITATPAVGYKLAEGSLRAYKTGDESAAVTITNGKFTMPAYGVTVTAAFEALPQVLTLAAVANGTLSAAPAQQVATDTEVTITATPAVGYKLAEGSLRAYKTGDESVAVTITNGKFTMPAYGVTVTAAFEMTTGIDTPEITVIDLYPNPTSDNVYIKGITTATRVEIYNLAGVQVLSTQVQPNQPISLVNLEAGVYLVKVEGKTLKVIKN